MLSHIEGKSSRHGRKRAERGSKRDQRKEKAKSGLEFVRNKTERIRSLDKRFAQDSKLDDQEPWVFEPMKWIDDYWAQDFQYFEALHVNKFVTKDFAGTMLPRWDWDTPQPIAGPNDIDPHELNRRRHPRGLPPRPNLDPHDDLSRFYRIPGFDIHFSFSEDDLCFDHSTLKVIAEYAPEFGFQCFKKSVSQMHEGNAGSNLEFPSTLRFYGKFNRACTFVYKYPPSKGVRATYLESVPLLKERYFCIEPMEGLIKIKNADILLRFDIGSRDLKLLISRREWDWSCVTAFITRKNFVVVVFTSGNQNFDSIGNEEYWTLLKYGEHESNSLGNETEIYGYEVDVFLHILHRSKNLCDLRLQKYCLFTRIPFHDWSVY